MSKIRVQSPSSGIGTTTVTSAVSDTDKTITFPDSTDTLVGQSTTNTLTTRVNAVGGRKNLIINGAMNVAQRGTSFVDPTSGTFCLDRWGTGMQNTTGVITVSQENDAPTAAEAGTNFVKSMRSDCTTADTAFEPSHRAYFSYKIEGQDLAVAGFGQAGVRYLTLSFWHKHTKTGIHSVAFNNGDRDRAYPMEYTQTTTNTWEKAELTFPVDTTGTWATDNTVGMWLFFAIAMGTNYQGTANTWAGSQLYGTSNQVNNLDSTSNNMCFTGVQLEVGDQATDFEHRSYGEELALCQRYFYNIFHNTTDKLMFPITFLSGTGNSGWTTFMVPYPVPMRTLTTLTHSMTDAKCQGAVLTNGSDTWTFYKQNQGYANKQGNGSSANFSGSGTDFASIGTYYVSPNNSSASHIMIASGTTFNFAAEL